MGFFKREGIDVLDLILLQKKGILKVKEIPREHEVLDFTKTDREGFVPMSSQSSSSSQSSATSAQSSPAAGFDFLSGLASNASSTPVISEPINTNSSGAGSFWDMPVPAVTSEVSESSSLSNDLKSHPHFNELAVKVDNLDYKMERLTEQLVLLQDKLDEFGRR